MDEQGVIFPNGHWQPATGTAGFVTHPDVSSTLWITAPSMVQQPGAPSGDPYPPQYGFPFTSDNVPQQAPVPGLNEVVDVSTGLSPYPNGGLAPPITSHSGTFPLSVIDPQLLAISGLNPMPQESMPEDPPDSSRPSYASSAEERRPPVTTWACETQPLGDDPTRLEFTLRDLESPQDDPVRLTFQQILLVIKFICGTLLYQSILILSIYCSRPYALYDDPQGPECTLLFSTASICQTLVKACYSFNSKLVCVPAHLYRNNQMFAPILNLGLNPYDVRRTCNMKKDSSCYEDRGYGDSVHNAAELFVPLLNKGVRLLVYAGKAGK
ncbi:hypothetical protein BU17DRAFT_72315 [Hysterangium stoloniferum]|nr:hypothetical protein BU17DRAFT_72315 [Hysterangium stoloniferum]